MLFLWYILNFYPNEDLNKLDSDVLYLQVNTKIRTSTTGFGFSEANHHQLSLDSNETQKIKKINWAKTQNRYNQSKATPQIKNKLNQVFNVESDDEESSKIITI